MFDPWTPQREPKPTLTERVVRAAEAALADHKYVSPIDVLSGTRLLAPSHVEAWRRGLIDHLRESIQGSPEKIKEDEQLVERMAGRIRQLFPGCPAREAQAIARHTGARGSGRVGRSSAGRALDDEALRLAVVAHVRHTHTNYDSLIMQGEERGAARSEVSDQIERVLSDWEKR